MQYLLGYSSLPKLLGEPPADAGALRSRFQDDGITGHEGADNSTAWNRKGEVPWGGYHHGAERFGVHSLWIHSGFGIVAAEVDCFRDLGVGLGNGLLPFLAEEGD